MTLWATYVYGSDKGGITPQIYRNDLLRAEIYPDSDDVADPLGNGADGVYDRVEYTYNRQGERVTKKDQNGTVHEYTYDSLGRQTVVRVTTLGTGVDGSVRRMATTYEVRGMAETLTSYATVGTGGSSSSSSGSSSSGAADAVNQVKFEYNHLGRLVKEYQEHDGVVDAGTPYAGYNFDDTASGGRFTKALRPTSVRYPNGRLVHYTYGDSGSIADAMNRIDAIKDDDSGSPGDTLAQYSYLGASSIVQVDYQEPDLRCDLAHGTGNDPYDGPMDRFGRVTDLLWRDYGSSTDAVRIKHGYDRASNRLWREDPVAAGYGKDFDELYSYDGMYHLTNMQRGNLDFTDPDNPVILSKNFAEDWSLDMTGNWSTYKQDDDGDGTWELNQSRTHNAVNEITQIAGASTHVAHDRAGNMTRTPKPDDWNAHYDLTYDPWNRLVKVEEGAAKIAEYTYDARNFRLVKKLYDCSGPSSSSSSSPTGEPCETRHFFYNRRWQCLEERVESGGALSEYAERHFLWSPSYIDALILRDRDTSDPPNGALDERLYAMQDPNWSVIGVAERSGTEHERYCYRTYGISLVLTPMFGSRGASGCDWQYRYTGRRLDARSASYQYRTRQHAADLGRFTSRDPSSDASRSDNAYAYVQNCPTSHVDPDGRKRRHFIVCPLTCSYNPFGLDFWAQTVSGWIAKPWKGEAIYTDSVADGVDQILASLDRADTIGSIQFWGHGGRGRMKVGPDTISKTDFSMDAPLAALLPRLDDECTIIFKGCDTFTGRRGHEFAQSAATFFNCTVGGHAAPIGFYLRFPEYHELQPGERPHWPIADPVPDECKKCKDCGGKKYKTKD